VYGLTDREYRLAIKRARPAWSEAEIDDYLAGRKSPDDNNPPTTRKLVVVAETGQGKITIAQPKQFGNREEIKVPPTCLTFDFNNG